MHTKRHRQNHDFTILYNLVGSCHTADQAYALLQDLREDRQMALDQYEVQKIKNQAREIRAKRLLTSREAADKLDGEAEILDLRHHHHLGEVLAAAARDEIAFIDRCIAELQPKRKYAHLTDAEAVEAIQLEEWEMELLYRVENFMVTTGSIPSDEFSNMRQHPNFAAKILPRIAEITECLKLPDGSKILASKMGNTPHLLEGIKL